MNIPKFSFLSESRDDFTKEFSGLPRSGKKFWKMNNFPGQGKVRDYIFSQGKFKNMKKVMEKSGNFNFFFYKDGS